MNITVVGSMNMDIANHVSRHPLPGETIKGNGTAYTPGGKGANQAVAAAKAGATVTMVGAVGNDGFAHELRTSLRQYGVNIGQVSQKDTTSGLAFITVDEHGENTIILSEGANGQVSPEDIEGAESVVTNSDVVLFQNEIPWDTTVFAMRLAKDHGVKVVLNPAPARKIHNQVFPLIDVLVINETEAAEIFGGSIQSIDDACETAAKIVKMGLKSVIITLGEKGSVYVDRDRTIHTPAYAVDVVDTTAAGDTFIGAFATEFTQESGIEYALRFASAASAVAVTRPGAQSSIPSREEIVRWQQSRMLQS